MKRLNIIDGAELLNDEKHGLKVLVKRDGAGNVDLCHDKDGIDKWFYWIPEDELATRRGLLHWIGHLVGKNWITADHIQQLIEISDKVKRERNPKAKMSYE